MLYINSEEKKTECILCDKIKKENDRDNYILYRDTLCFVIMNLYPYNTGHLMISPYKHTGAIDNLSNEELLQLMKLTQFSVENLKKSMKPEGYNIGINIGKNAGAGISDHLHLHIVPRWNGDTNFMPIVGETKVIPQHLSETYKKLKEFFT
ncbi:MAG: HIT domain-containing protein [bacterium]